MTLIFTNYENTIVFGRHHFFIMLGRHQSERRCPMEPFTIVNNFFLKISSFSFVNLKNVFTFVHSSKFMSYGM